MWSKLKFLSILYLLGAVGVLTTVAADEKMSMEDMIATFKSLGESCEDEITEEIVRELLSHKENPRRETKCFARCIAEIFEVFSSDSNALNEEKLVEMSNVMYEGRGEDIRAMVRHCNEKVARMDDKCDATHEISMCMYHEAKKREFEMPEFE